MTHFSKILAAAALFAGTSVAADTIELKDPMQAASLHDGGLDMVVYFTEAGDLFEVVGTWVERDGAYEPARIVMGMADGDDVSFTMPGQSQVAYSFARSGDALTVSADLTDEQVTALDDGIEAALLVE